MSEFIFHTLKSAPAASKPYLKKAEQTLGFIPNLMAAMSEATVALKSSQTLNNLFDKTSFAENGLIKRRIASINDKPIQSSKREFT